MVSDLLFGLGIGVLFTAVGLGQVYRGVRSYRSKAAVTGTPTTPVADVAPGGSVAVEGTVVAPDDDRAEGPVFGETGVAVATVVKGVDTDSGTWEIHREARSVPFAVEDDTGQVGVEVPPAATVDPAETTGETYTFSYGDEDIPDGARDVSDSLPFGNLREPVPDHVEAYHRRVEELVDPEDVGSLRDGNGSGRRYEEGGIVPGDEVYVRGQAVGREAEWGESGVAIAGGDDPASVSVVQGGAGEHMDWSDRLWPAFSVAIGTLVALAGAGVIAVVLLTAG